MSTEELLKKLEEDRDAYLATFQKVHEALAKSIAATKQLPCLPSSPKSRSATNRIMRVSLGEADRPSPSTSASVLSIGFSGPSTFKSSVISGETDDLSDDDEALYVQDPLPATSFDDEHLRAHLKEYKWNWYARKLLQPIFKEDGQLRSPEVFGTETSLSEDRWYSLYQAFDVGTDGAPLPLHGEKAEPKMTLGPDQTMWHFMKEINIDATKRQSIGRITILREPSPVLFAAAHLALNKVFDMDEIFDNIVQQGQSTAYMTRAFSSDPRKQKCFMFSFEYFTIIGDDCQPMRWQESDQEKVRNPNHIPISRCSSVVALSLVGQPIQKLRNSHRRAQTKYGYVYSPWSPWHVLNMQCYPDWKSNTDIHESSNHYVNGPEAFLTTLLTEYRDAQKRFEEISQRIQRLITPSAEFMFNGELRDKLLFEDDEFTYSRRYFWAFQTLGSMNQSIKAMVDSYEDTFTHDVWDGRHKTLWPVGEDSPRNSYWRKRMASLRNDLEFEMRALKVIMEENMNRQKEIKNLRDNLFSGTSVLESRKSVQQAEITVQQGHNIKLLTLVNMFFLPLTFVTSVFGMTNMDPKGSFWRFAVVMTTVCIPFFLLIGSMNTSAGMRFWKHKFGGIFRYLFASFRWTSTKVGTLRKQSDVVVSDTTEPPKMSEHHRSLSASEGIAERTVRMQALVNMQKESEDGDVNPSPRRVVSFGQALKHEPAGSSSSTNTKKGAIPIQQSSILLSSRSGIALEAVVAPTSYSKSKETSGSTEMSDINTSRAVLQQDGLGIWDMLRSSRRRNGGRENDV